MLFGEVGTVSQNRKWRAGQAGRVWVGTCVTSRVTRAMSFPSGLTEGALAYDNC